ncbi:MAG TPA: sigma-54 dependent transcriptional regulator, partial [Polyangia bacterium]
MAVNDDDDVLARLLVTLPARGFEVACCRTAEEAMLRIPREQPDVVLTDHGMRDIDGIDLCERIVTSYPDLPVILLTAFGTVETAVAAMRAGAFDFIVKPLDLQALASSLERAIRQRRLNDEVDRLQQRSVDRKPGFGELVGQSPAMKQVFTFVEQTAGLNASVLITGESGTGKELVARALHRKGKRPDGPFVAVNCAALPEALLESELFGYARGAFTGAQGPRQGLLATSSGGTLFLDEIGEMSLVLQPKLLRALQERKVRPVGSDTETTFDTRVIAATNRDLESAVREGDFRTDLYFRLNVLGVHLPPLRSRGTDVLLLAQGFVEQYAAEMSKAVAGFGPAVAERLLAYDWPGNVRELQNLIERAVALARGPQ